MAIPFFRPSLVIENISTKAVRLLGLATIQPGQTVDLYGEVEATTLYEDLILKALERPWGDLYNEVVLKKTLIIHSLVLSSFYYGIVAPRNINATNAPFAGAVPSVVDDERFTWIAPAISLVTPPLQIGGGVLSIPPASATSDGYLTKEDWLTFTANTKPPIKIWQYQDFSAPLSTSLSLTTFQNGTGLAFSAPYIISDTAEITLSSDSSVPPTTTTTIPAKYLPSNRVKVTSHIGTTVILNVAPDSSLSCRVFYLIELPAGAPLPSGYQEDPEFLNASNLDYIDDNYVNQNQDETIFGIKTFADDIIASGMVGIGTTPSADLDVVGLVRTTSLQITTGAFDGYYWKSNATGLGYWAPISTGVADHGQLIGLSDDDHGQYLLLSGSSSRNIMTGYLDGYSGRLRIPNVSNPVAEFPLPKLGELAYDTNDGYVVVYTSMGWQSVAGAASGISEYQHDNLDDLVHNLAENYYEEIIRSGSRVTAVIDWTSSLRVLKIRESQYTYSGTKVVQEVNIQYDVSGSEVQRLTTNYTYSGSMLLYSDTVETGS